MVKNIDRFVYDHIMHFYGNSFDKLENEFHSTANKMMNDFQWNDIFTRTVADKIINMGKFLYTTKDVKEFCHKCGIDCRKSANDLWDEYKTLIKRQYAKMFGEITYNG